MIRFPRTTALAMGLLLAMGCGARAAGPKDGDGRRGEWVKLATRTVDFSGDHDVLDVGGDGRFTAIRFAVDEGDMVMDRIRVTFRNGEKFEPETRVEFKEGTRSRDIDLPGDARFIRRIEFFYRSVGRHGKAIITVFGRLK